jgi:CRISPR-associated protein Cmr4
MKKTDFYFIKAISNLHVGSGEGDFSHIDKLVQRDTITQLPTIHASSIKGALREGMEHNYLSESTHHVILDVFGSDQKKDRGKSQRQGKYNFFDGHLLFLPIRSSHHFFYRATCSQLLVSLADSLSMHNTHEELEKALRKLAEVNVEKGKPSYIGKNIGPIQLEDWTGQNSTQPITIPSELPERIALLHDYDFASLAQQLPIISRNYLEDGKSENLWYEEVVPREAMFYSTVTRPSAIDNLNTWLNDRKNMIQLGANATVGYGLCSLSKF